MTYSDYLLKGAKTKGAKLRFADPSMPAPPTVAIPRSGAEWAPRRVYLKPADFAKHGFTTGCMGCRWIETGLGAKRGHNEACRARMEAAMAEGRRALVATFGINGYVGIEIGARYSKQ